MKLNQDRSVIITSGLWVRDIWIDAPDVGAEDASKAPELTRWPTLPK